MHVGRFVRGLTLVSLGIVIGACAPATAPEPRSDSESAGLASLPLEPGDRWTYLERVRYRETDVDGRVVSHGRSQRRRHVRIDPGFEQWPGGPVWWTEAHRLDLPRSTARPRWAGLFVHQDSSGFYQFVPGGYGPGALEGAARDAEPGAPSSRDVRPTTPYGIPPRLRYPLRASASWLTVWLDTARVVGRRRIQVPAGSFDAWQVHFERTSAYSLRRTERWYGDAGLLRVVDHFEFRISSKEQGKPPTWMTRDEESELESYAIARPGRIEP
jgi:hypothetical protein